MLNQLPNNVMKAISVGLASSALDRFYFRRNDMTSNLAFGLAVGIGEMSADVIAKKVLPQTDYKNVEVRAVELGTVTGVATFLDRVVLEQNSLNGYDIIPRLSSVIVLDVIYETAMEMMN